MPLWYQVATYGIIRVQLTDAVAYSLFDVVTYILFDNFCRDLRLYRFGLGLLCAASDVGDIHDDDCHCITLSVSCFASIRWAGFWGSRAGST
jgi:hypothetical protein